MPARLQQPTVWLNFVQLFRTMKVLFRAEVLCSEPKAVQRANSSMASVWDPSIPLGRSIKRNNTRSNPRWNGLDGKFDPRFLVRISCTKAKQEKEANFLGLTGQEVLKSIPKVYKSQILNVPKSEKFWWIESSMIWKLIPNFHVEGWNLRDIPLSFIMVNWYWYCCFLVVIWDWAIDTFEMFRWKKLLRPLSRALL